jgi:hypothetical protein
MIEKPGTSKAEANKNPLIDSQTDTPHYDRGIIPAEVAAREEREGKQFLHTPSKEHDKEALTDDQTSSESIDTTKGYTVDQEGLLNNYAIEPEMYINEPGDLREQNKQLEDERRKELAELNEGEDGKLTMDADRRHRGQGVI